MSRMQSSGFAFAYSRKAVSSSGKANTKEWAMVPTVLTPYNSPAMRFEVALHPPIMLARLACIPPSPWARRSPKSAMRRDPATHWARFALVAMRDWKLIMLSRSVSMTCVSTRFPSTIIRGSIGNTISPSLTE